MSDASWWFSSDWRRDNILREQLESQAMYSARTTARLRSQLTRVQGSMDRRLTALASAFDAYVELGDVREELGSLQSSVPVRRRARDAIAALRAGTTPTPLPEGQAGHWIGGAMNRVLHRLGKYAGPGHPSSDGPEESAASSGNGFGAMPVPSGGPDARTFEALVLAMLGHGELAADLLPGLLTTDGGLTLEQQVLFRAAVDGKFGPDALADLRPVFAPALAHSEPSEWAQWLASEAGPGPLKILQWVSHHTTPVLELPEHSAGAQPIDVAGYAPGGQQPTESEEMSTDEAVEQLVNEMIAEGAPVERELIRRAAILRAKIENPDHQHPPARWEIDAQPAVAVLRDTFGHLAPGMPGHAELLQWILPAVRPEIDAALETEPDAEPTTVVVRSFGGRVSVDEDGADDKQRRAAIEAIDRAFARQQLPKGPLVAAGVVAAIGVVLAVLARHPAPVIVAGIVAGILVGRAYWQIRPGDTPMLREREIGKLKDEIEKARTRVQSITSAREEARQEREQLADLVRERLAEQDPPPA